MVDVEESVTYANPEAAEAVGPNVRELILLMSHPPAPMAKDWIAKSDT
jgi:hypothetical protein